VRLGIASLPLPGVAQSVITRASASAGYQIVENEQRFGNVLRARSTRNIPVMVTTTFANGLTAAYNASFGESEGIETTGLRRGSDVLHGIQLRASFDAPESLGERFDQPITASLGFNYAARQSCDTSGFGAAADSVAARCAAIIDNLQRDVHFTLETMFDDLNLGAQFSLNDHKSFIGLRDGSREFRLAIFANFNLGVGVLPSGLGQPSYGF
jgi:hypothetical protein